jgi:hypothetical protein
MRTRMLKRRPAYQTWSIAGRGGMDDFAGTWSGPAVRQLNLQPILTCDGWGFARYRGVFGGPNG